MKIIDRTVRAVATVAVIVLGILAILTIMEVISVEQLTSSALKTTSLLGIIALMAVGIAFIQPQK
jgi:uncharacterized membrane protein YobD (UPF0266 family)